MSSSTDAAADAALDEVLSETGPNPEADDQQPSGPVRPDDPGRDLAPADDLDDDVEPTCTEAEAREMADTLRASLVEFDSTLTRIMQTRAWRRLGYDSPKAFVLAELGPASGQDGSVSRAHAYRLARVAVLIYELAMRMGEDAYTLELTERAIRSIPAKYDGQMLDRLEGAISAAGPDISPEEAQEVVDGEIAQARREIEDTGGLSEPGQSTTETGSTNDAELAALGGDATDLDFTNDPDTGRAGERDAAGRENDPSDDPQSWDGEQGSTNRDNMRAAFTVEGATDEAIGAAADLRELVGLLSRAPYLAEKLPGILEAATDDELLDLSENAQAAASAIDQIKEAADSAL